MKPVFLIGAGNVGWHLGQAFHRAGIPIGGIWSRNPDRSAALATLLDSRPLASPMALSGKEGLALIAVPDRAIAELLTAIPWQDIYGLTLAHTSGGTPMDVFPEGQSGVGVFYPLQTLTQGFPTDFSQVPVLISARDPDRVSILAAYASLITARVVPISDEDRPLLHLAAVFLNNFVHHIGIQSNQILATRQLDRTLLLPLLRETMHKMETTDPALLQTGPARRGDLTTILTHLGLLKDQPRLAALYRLLSSSINPELPI
jgi:predicted short-subunit dehydrogenase-like oxidoreductase (DUF2520 family)